MRLLKVVFLLVLLAANTVFASLNEYDLEEIYNSSLKIVSDTPIEVQENTNYLLLDKNNLKVISVDKENINLYPNYMHIGYDIDNSFIINSENNGYTTVIDDAVEVRRDINGPHVSNFEDIFLTFSPIFIVFLFIVILVQSLIRSIFIQYLNNN